MMNCWSVYGLTLLFLSALVIVSHALPWDANECSKYCTKTYGGHTPDKLGPVATCQKGCQMFQVIRFATQMTKNEANHACSLACNQAFPLGHEKRNACSDGCKHQIPFSGNGPVLIDHLEIHGNSDPLRHYVAAFMKRMWKFMGNVYDKMSGSFKSIKNWFGSKEGPQSLLATMNKKIKSIFGSHPSTENEFRSFLRHSEDQTQSSIALSRSRGDGKPYNPIYVYGNRKRPPVAKPDLVDHSNDQNVGHTKPDVILKTMRPTISVEESARLLGFTPSYVVHDIKETPHTHNPLAASSAGDPDDSWMTYLARRTDHLSMATRWLLLLAMTICVISMIWICLAIAKVLPRYRPAIFRASKHLDYKGGKDDYMNGVNVYYVGDFGNNEKMKLVDGDISPFDLHAAPPPYEPKQ